MEHEKLTINKILNAYFKAQYNNSKNDHSNFLFFRSTVETKKNVKNLIIVLLNKSKL